MSTEAQASLFSDALLAQPARRTGPDPEAIRGRLHGLLSQLQAADSMPLSDRDARMWRTVVPNMVKWLPNAEAECLRTAFVREMQRLTPQTAER